MDGAASLTGGQPITQQSVSILPETTLTLGSMEGIEHQQHESRTSK